LSGDQAKALFIIEAGVGEIDEEIPKFAEQIMTLLGRLMDNVLLYEASGTENSKVTYELRMAMKACTRMLRGVCMVWGKKRKGLVDQWCRERLQKREVFAGFLLWPPQLLASFSAMFLGNELQPLNNMMSKYPFVKPHTTASQICTHENAVLRTSSLAHTSGSDRLPRLPWH
jgi:hypothetical protein